MMPSQIRSIAFFCAVILTTTIADQDLSRGQSNLIFGPAANAKKASVAFAGFTPEFRATSSSSWPRSIQKQPDAGWEVLLDQPAPSISDQPMKIETLVKGLREHGLPVVLTHSAKDDEAAEEDLVTLPLRNLPLRDRLMFGLSEINTTISLVDGLVKIISKDDVFAEEFMMVATYDVTALGVNQFLLQEHIMNMVETETWQDNGGLGTISAIAVGGKLLLSIGNTYKVHRKVRGHLSLAMKLASE